MSARNEGDYAPGRSKAEYYYRLGRINDELGKDEAALSNYQLAISSGKQLKYYFAANSALQMGKIYEKQKNYSKAKVSFNTAIQMKNHEYESSIETQAKAGLSRIR
ncbi:Tetratricopeptide repeat protein [compost metagenome]